MQITLLIIGFCLMAYGGWKIMAHYLLETDPNSLQGRPHINTVRLYDGGYSKIAKESEGKPSLQELAQEYEKLKQEGALQDEVVNQRGAGPISGETS